MEMQVQTLQRIRRAIWDRRPLVMSVVVLGWSLKYTIALAIAHHDGPELYGVLVAALAAGAAGANLVLLRTSRVPLIATAVVLALWVIVALGGLAGTIAHVIGPVPGHGPMDLRPRPIAAPLVFTLLGSAGAVALALGQRARMRAGTKFEKE
jgi:hypothetical protein